MELLGEITDPYSAARHKTMMEVDNFLKTALISPVEAESSLASAIGVDQAV
jgi:hypothetical protein